MIRLREIIYSRLPYIIIIIYTAQTQLYGHLLVRYIGVPGIGLVIMNKDYILLYNHC